jgi:type IX secretion system PorP/SprF family membrane protein
MHRYRAILLLLILSHLKGFAQDVQFSQPYSNPTLLNPAFAGTSDGIRFAMNYRNQWPGIENNYTAFGAGVDSYLREVNGGIGFSLVKDVAGIHRLSNTLGSLMYSQHISISRRMSMSLGAQAGIGQRNFDDSKLFFADQVINETATSHEVNSLNLNTSFADLSFGVLVYRDDFWVGFSAHHANQPNQSLLGSEDKLPVKFSIHGGGDLPFNKLKEGDYPKRLRAAFNYKSQGNWDQLDLGAYYTVRQINFGAWYRGIPLKAYQPGYQNNESLVVLVGYEHTKGISIGYSYDLTLSRLAGHSGGAHEISIVYETRPKRKRPKKRIIPCAKF